MSGRYVPDRGDIVWLQFNPQSRHEQAGRRPAFVVSPRVYNRKVGLALFCPITKQIKGHPFEVVLPEGGKTTGSVLSDQIKSLDWRARQATRLDRAPQDVTKEVLAKVIALITDDA